MKRLILMRHAKSDWSTSAGSDHARPLNARGKEAAGKLGHWLRDTDVVPQAVLCSSARRTGETCAGLGLTEGAEITFSRALYLASPQEMMTSLRAAQKDVVLMIGHNPGIAELARELVQTPPDHPGFDRYPTGATLVADFDIAVWSQLAPGQANARHFVVPRDL